MSSDVMTDSFTTGCYATFCMGCNIRRNAAYIQGRQPECFDYVLGTAMCLMPYVGGLIMSIHACYNRNEIKKEYGIDGGEFNCCDCFTGFCCTCCTSIQHTREFQERGDVPKPKKKKTSKKGGKSSKKGSKGSKGSKGKGKSSKRR